MPTLTPLHMLLIGIVFMLLICLGLVYANRWHQARQRAEQYRTASGRVIERDSKNILRTSMATPRHKVRAGSVATAMHQPGNVTALLNPVAIQRRAEAAARADARLYAHKRANPFAAGSRNAITWFSYYEPAYDEALLTAMTVQTTAQQASTEPAAA